MTWTADRLREAAESPGLINGDLVPANPPSWEMHPALHESDVELLVETLRSPEPGDEICPKCGSDEVATFANSSTCLRVCSWRGTPKELQEAGRTFYRATMAGAQIPIGPVKILAPEGMAAIGRTREKAVDKFKVLLNRVKVTAWAHRKNSSDYGEREIASLMELEEGAQEGIPGTASWKKLHCARHAGSRHHDLKCWPAYFQAMVDGRKPFEVRKDDRKFEAGDALRLREWDEHLQQYTGRGLSCDVTYKVPGGQFGIEAGYCVLGVRVLSFTDPEIEA